MKPSNYAVYCFLVHYFTETGNLIDVDRIGFELPESECSGNTTQELEKKVHQEAKLKMQHFGFF